MPSKRRSSKRRSHKRLSKKKSHRRSHKRSSKRRSHKRSSKRKSHKRSLKKRSHKKSSKLNYKGICIYISKDGIRCNHDEVLPKVRYCNQHLNKLFNVTLNKSNIKNAGNGLFAGKEGFKKETIIGEYSRYDIKLTKKQIDKCYTHKCTEYLYCDNNNCWDAKTQFDIFTRYSNDSRDKRNNAYFDDIGGRSFMISSKNIKPGTEIFTTYGESYDWSWLDNKK